MSKKNMKILNKKDRQVEDDVIELILQENNKKRQLLFFIQFMVKSFRHNHGRTIVAEEPIRASVFECNSLVLFKEIIFVADDRKLFLMSTLIVRFMEA